MTRHPDIGWEAAEHADAALAVCPLFWIPRGCQHPEVTSAYDVQRAVTVADGKRPRGASARVAAGDVRGERDRPHTDRVAILEAVIDARGRVAEDADPDEGPNGRTESGSLPPEARESALASLAHS